MTQPTSPTASSSLLDRTIASIRILGALLVIVAMGVWAWKATRWTDELELVDSFDVSAPVRSFMQRAEGIFVAGEGLAVGGGEIAVRQYGVTRAEHQRLFIHIEKYPGSQGRIGLWLTASGETQPLDASVLDGQPIEITEFMAPGNAQLEVWIENPAPAGSPPEVILRSLKISRKGIVSKVHVPTLLFYGLTGAIFWFAVFVFAIPEGIRQITTEREGLAPRARTPWMVMLLGATLAIGWLLGLPEWTQLKDYDDRAAAGNAALLLDSGFDQSQVYFRSRVRPGFPAIAQPVLALSPHRLSGYWSNASDNFRQDWKIYDQEGWEYGLFTYPHLTWMSQVLALVMVMGFYGIYRRLEVLPVVAMLAAVIAVVYYGRSLTIAITQTVNLCVNVLVVWHFLSGGENSNWRHRGMTGLLLGLAALVKETAATTVIALAIFTLIDGPIREVGRRILRSAPMWIAALLLPLIYFGFVAEDGLREPFANFDNHLAQDELNPFEPLSFSTGIRDLRVVFSTLGLLAVGVGIAAASAGRFASRADRLMLSWAIGCLPVFTLPYIFPRFLKYFVPSFAFWSVRVIEFAREKRQTREKA